MNISSGQAVDAGKEGEIWIRSAKNMVGYMGNPQATAATVDREGWLHTGVCVCVCVRGEGVCVSVCVCV